MFKTTLKAGLLAIGASAMLSLTPQQAHAAECGTDETITIAEMTWLSASTLAYVTDRIVKDGMGCKTKIVPGDTVPTATSILSKGEPMIAPELWLSTSENIWEKIVDKGIAFKANDIFEDGGAEGWFIPDYVAEANPDLKSVADLEKHVDLFKEVASNGKGRLYACPPGWACEILNNNLFKALDMESKNFELFSPGSGANLKASIARKVTRKQPVLAYYWGPTAVIGKYNLVKLDMPAYDADAYACLAKKDCESPAASDFKPGEVAVAVVSELKEKAPKVVEFLGKMQVPNDVINSVLAWGDDNSASPEEIANYFFKNHEDVWTKWVNADIAAKVKATL
ncbi:MAG: ABC transporter substrate-binding protein [Burkholderiaceae bacterium]